jgi:hypothetical protein
LTLIGLIDKLKIACQGINFKFWRKVMTQFSSDLLTCELLNTIQTVAPYDFHWLTNQRQVQMLNRVSEISLPELETIGQFGGVDRVNQFLIQRGMGNCTLQPIPNDGIAAAIYLKILSKWLIPGQRLELTTAANKLVEGVKLKSQVYKDNFGKLFACAYLENGDFVLIENTTPLDPSSEVLENSGDYFVTALLEQEFLLPEYGFVHFPMLDINYSRNWDEIIGMSEESGKYQIDEAKGQLKLALNEIGVKLEVAISVGMRSLSIPMPKLTWEVKDTFCLHFVRPTDEGECARYCSIQATPDTFNRPEIEF